MKQKGIAVEVSLTSSDVILGVRGSRHPLRQLLRAGVPVALSTDDEGVSRTDLTNEYQRAVEEQGLGYAEIKAISRHSIDYSFLPDADKVRLRRRLDSAFQRFETRTAPARP
jgi:adenosine deaminase